MKINTLSNGQLLIASVINPKLRSAISRELDKRAGLKPTAKAVAA